MIIFISSILLTILATPPFDIQTVDIQAYLDPGSGSFIVQLIIGGIVGLLVAIKIYWRRIRAFFSKSSLDEESTPQQAPVNEQDFQK